MESADLVYYTLSREGIVGSSRMILVGPLERLLLTSTNGYLDEESERIVDGSCRVLIAAPLVELCGGGLECGLLVLTVPFPLPFDLPFPFPFPAMLDLVWKVVLKRKLRMDCSS